MSEIDPRAVQRIDGIIEEARAQRRAALFEHEVYGILSAVGLDVPRFLFVRDPSEVSAEKLSPFGRAVVAKIVSASVPHKRKMGGVRRITTRDPLFVQYALTRMCGDIVSRFPAERAPRIEGVLLVEYVPHTRALGYEVLLGFREDPAFGPVLCVSKGGDDAEFFAANYDPANLFLPPMDHRSALSLMRSLHIRRRFEEIGHPEYLDLMADALAGISRIAMGYSTLAGSSRAVFTHFEVNPFAISKDHRFLPLDGLAEIREVEERDSRMREPRGTELDGFFKPKGIAVVGPSADLSKYSLGRDIAELLLDLGRDDLFFVNPKRGKMRIKETEYPLYAGMSDLPAPAELAVYAAPAANAPEFLRNLSGTSVKAVILIPGVPVSIRYGEYARMLREAAPPGVRILGPNCMGVFWAPPSGGSSGLRGLNTLFINEQRLEVRASERSNAALITQSGALAVTALDKLKGLSPFRCVVSFGNKVDVTLSDLLEYFIKDASIRAIALYVEGLDPGEGRKIFDSARVARKPIIAYKGGRTEAGGRSAASHTASMSGSYDVFRAAAAQAGIILSETIEEYLDLIKIFSLLSSKPPSGNRVAGVVNAGFESTVGADELGGLRQARLSEDTTEALRDVNRKGLVDMSTPFLDVTPMTDDAEYAAYVEAVLRDPGVDCVFVAIVPHAVTLKTIPETCRDPDALANRLVGLGRRYGKPLVVSVNAGRHYADFVSVMEEGGLPVFAEIRSAISSLDRFVSYHLGVDHGDVPAR
jgi:3-hydroxypropionyl-CoA synthetase (ADP-forming)